MTKLKDCKKEFFPCQHCGTNSPMFDESLKIYRCWKCGRRVRFHYVPKTELSAIFQLDKKATDALIEFFNHVLQKGDQMGIISINVEGSFTTKSHTTYSAMKGGHAYAVAKAIGFLVDKVLPEAIRLDHSLHERGLSPSIGFGEVVDDGDAQEDSG